MHTLLFFVAMLLFDLTTTAINNYMDYRKAMSEEYRETSNIIGQKELSEKVVISIIIIMLAIATALGLWLVVLTDLIVLLIGMLCFGIGIFYTFGPIPLSRMPLGEVFSGVTMGFGIIFLTIYINAFDQGIAQLSVEGSMILFQLDILNVLAILLISLPCVFTIAGIMLANNICDLEEDIQNKRFTLPYYIGKNNAIKLFDILYIATFISFIAAVAIGLLPSILLLVLLIIVPVYKQLKKFHKRQKKAETFVVSIRNLVMINGTFATILLLSLIIGI